MFKSIFYFFKIIFLSLGYNCIYYFSYLQIKYEHLKLYFTKNITDYGIEIYDEKQNLIKYVTTSEINNNYHKNYFIIKHELDNLVKLIDTNIWWDINFNKLDWKQTKYKFISISYNDDNLSNYVVKLIHLNSNKGNYYVVDNIINHTFIRYYMKKHYDYIVEDDVSYKIKIMDHKLKQITLNSSQKIILKENDYIIV